MAKPKLFIGSSQKNLRVAGVLAEALEESAQVRVWNEGVFGLNQGFLETLLKQLEEYDFAAFVLASDDLTTSADQSRPSPRDNVLFESGLFMLFANGSRSSMRRTFSARRLRREKRSATAATSW